MKKVISLLLALIIVFSFAACNTKNTGADPSGNNEVSQNENLEGDLESILEKIYDTAEVDEYFKEYAKTGLQITEITDENIKYHLGKEGIEYESAIASEPIMSSSAYSLCLVRVKEGADIEKIKTDIKENVDPRKWVCVGVDEENVIVDSIGDVVILIMSNDQGKALHDAFLAMKG